MGFDLGSVWRDVVRPVIKYADPTRIVGDAVGIPTSGGLIGGAVEQVGDSLLGGGNEPAMPDVPGMDPKLKEIRDKQIAAANKFRKNLPQYESDQYNTALGKSRKKLAESLRQSDEGFNRRGLLYSGARQAKGADISGQAMADLDLERQDIVSSLEKAASEFEDQALRSELAVNSAEADIQNQLYNRALAERTARQSGLNAILGAGGGIIGAGLAKKG